ncbi:MAG TPA: peptidylprolyl isomerase [Burkholderiaceae bacterium]|nr:peptidylprolyl isomerase [Burkholderiaceae bacterium]
MRRILVAAACAVSFVGAVQTASAQNTAVVNNKPIPKTLEDAFVKQIGQPDTPELRKRIHDQLVEREILMQEATKRGIPERPDVKFQIDINRQNTVIQGLLRDELQKNPITDAQVQAEYDKQKQAAGDKEYKARHILVGSEAEAKDIIDQLNKGAKFEELAKKSKDAGSAANGGDLDWAAPGAYVKPFSEAMVKLEKGQFTQAPVQTQFGWHVIRLDDVRDQKAPPLEQVKQQITEALQQQRIQAFVEGLKKKAKVQ